MKKRLRQHKYRFKKKQKQMSDNNNIEAGDSQFTNQFTKICKCSKEKGLPQAKIFGFANHFIKNAKSFN